MAATTLIPQHPLRNAANTVVPFDLHVWGAPQGYNFLDAHRHHFHEILVFATGAATHDIDFHSYQTKARTVHFVASDNVHLLVREPTSSGYSLLFATDYFPQELIAQLPFSKVQPTMQLSAGDFRQINALAQQIRRELDGSQYFSDRIIKALMETMLFQLARIYKTKHPQSPRSSLPAAMQLFKELVRAHYLEHYTVAMYAERLNLSPKHLIELCKKHMGKTPLKYIQEETICEAKRLLFHTQLSVKEIAYRLNFDEPGNFSKYFKSNTGYTPAAYRSDAR